MEPDGPAFDDILHEEEKVPRRDRASVSGRVRSRAILDRGGED